jgi:hypothetical protein
MPAVAVQSNATRTMQGIAIPATSVDRDQFFAKTRRHQSPEKTVSYGGGGIDQVFELRKADILASITVRFVGQVVVTGGTTNTTAAWPLGIAGARFTANGQANLINTGPASAAGGGLQHLRARDYMKKSDLTDRGVVQTIGGASRSSGTLALSAESWGPASSATAVPAGTYPVDLTFHVPVAEDERDLIGAIFLQTSSSDLTLTLSETPTGQLFYGGTATSVVLSGQWQVATTKFSIPIGADGQIVVPDLSMFHSIIGSRVGSGIGNGENEQRLIGQGAGKALLRIWGRVVNGATTASAPLAMNSTNFGPLSWRYGNNDTPDTFSDGSAMRSDMERRYNTDIGGIHGYFCHDFAHENVFRDTVDMGTAAELRIVSTVQAGVTLTNPALEYVTETMFLAGSAA